MNEISFITEGVTNLFNKPYEVVIKLDDVRESKTYLELIVSSINSNSRGVYIFYDDTNQKIVYIGMAGKIKNDGKPTKQTLSERLRASRGKSFSTTSKFIENSMIKLGSQKFRIIVLEIKQGELPAYLEASLINNYYKIYNCLPTLNNDF